MVYQQNTLRDAIGFLLLLLGLQPSANGEAIDLSGDLTVATDYAFRGVSQTDSAPAVQGTLAVEHDNGWYAYLWASNVDFTEAGEPDDGADSEFDLEVGYYRDLSDRIAVSLGWVNYFFPRTESGYHYNYNEWNGTVIVDERYRFTASHSKDVFASGQAGTSYAVGTTVDVLTNITVKAEIGHYDLDDAYGHSYNYGEIALVGRFQFLDWRMSYIRASRSAGIIFSPSATRDRLILSLGVSF